MKQNASIDSLLKALNFRPAPGEGCHLRRANFKIFINILLLLNNKTRLQAKASFLWGKIPSHRNISRASAIKLLKRQGCRQEYSIFFKDCKNRISHSHRKRNDYYLHRNPLTYIKHVKNYLKERASWGWVIGVLRLTQGSAIQ